MIFYFYIKKHTEYNTGLMLKESWNNFLPGSPAEIIHNKEYSSNYLVSSKSLHVYDCVFTQITSSSRGGAIDVFTNQVLQLLVERSMFYMCHSTTLGGAVSFLSDGDVAFSMVCGNNCWCDETVHFSQLNPNSGNQESGKVVDSSVVNCGRMQGRYCLTLYDGSFKIANTNSSRNKSETASGIELGRSKAVTVSYSSITENLCQNTVIQLYSGKGQDQLSNCNIIRNQEKSTQGTGTVRFTIGGQLNVQHCCILENKAKYTFYCENSPIRVYDSTIDIKTKFGDVVINSLTGSSFILPLELFETRLCEAKYDYGGGLTTRKYTIIIKKGSSYSTHIYAKDGSKYVEITTSRQFVKSLYNNHFSIPVYARDTSYCSSYTIIGTYISSESSNTIIIQYSDIPISCKPSYHITIKKSGSYATQIFAKYKSQYSEITTSVPYTHTEKGIQFSVEVFAKNTKYCTSYTSIGTYRSSESNNPISISYSNVPDSCKPRYCITIKKSGSFSTNIYAKYKSQYNELTTSAPYNHCEYDNQFSVEVFAKNTKYCTSYTSLGIYKSSESNNPISISYSNLPDSCRTIYSITIKKSGSFSTNIYAKYKSQYNEITTSTPYTNWQYDSQFSVEVFAKNTKYCTSYTSIGTYRSSESNNPISISYSDVPDSCRPRYCITIKKSDSYATQIFAKYNSQYNEITTSAPYNHCEYDNQFSVEVFAKNAKYCTSYTSVNTYISSESSNTIIIQYSDIPKSCKPSYHITIKKSGSYTTQIFAKYKSQYSEITTSVPYTHTEKGIQFSVEVFAKNTKYCTSYTSIGTYRSSESNNPISISYSDVPDSCKPHYIITFKKSPELGYSHLFSYFESKFYEITEQTPYRNEIVDIPYNVSVYISNIYCNRPLKITTFPAEINGVTYTIDKHYLPDKCLPKYRITIKKGKNIESFHIFAKKDSIYEEILIDNPYVKEEVGVQFSVGIYVKSEHCKDYTFVNTYISEEINNAITITRCNIPAKCRQRINCNYYNQKSFLHYLYTFE